MYKYIFNINCETNLTYQNARSVISNHLSLLIEEDDDRPPHYSITSLHLNNLNNPEEVWQKGLALSTLYNGISRLIYFNPLENISICEKVIITDVFLKDDSNYSNITKNDFFQLPPLYPFDKSLNFKDLQIANESKHIFVDLLNLSIKDEKIYNLLLQLGVSLDWINLYSILDTIKYLTNDFNKLVYLSNYKPNDIDLFTHTSNNFGLLSYFARHGQKGWTQPAKNMNLSTAQDIILKLSTAFFSENHNLKF